MKAHSHNSRRETNRKARGRKDAISSGNERREAKRKPDPSPNSRSLLESASAHEQAARTQTAHRKRRSLAATASLYRRAAELGDPGAMLNLANCLELGRGAKRDMAESLKWQKRAAALGCGAAAYNLGVTYRDSGAHRKAVRWFARAVELGDDSAQLELAKAELLGLGTRRSVKGAMLRLRRLHSMRTATIADKEEAAILTAKAYLDGWVVPRSLQTAVGWLESACKTKSKEATAMLDELREWMDVR